MFDDFEPMPIVFTDDPVVEDDRDRQSTPSRHAEVGDRDSDFRPHLEDPE